MEWNGHGVLGSEVKSLRVNSANIAESYAGVDAGELWLVNSILPLMSRPRPLDMKNSGGANCWSAAKSWHGYGLIPSAKADFGVVMC